MGSPESTNPAPKSPTVQDSPIFSYVSSLSPIKPVNVRPVMQAYENIDVPSPQLVFKTPHFSRPRNSNLLERSQHPALSGAQNLSPGHANNIITEFSENMDITGPSASLPMAEFISCIEKECAGHGPSPDQPCISPSSCVNVFLADPLEDGDNLSSSPDVCSKRAAKDIQGDSTSTDENQMRRGKEDLAQAHPCASAVSANELIADSTERSTSTVLHGLHSKQDTGLPHTSQNDCTSTEETTAELHVPNDKKCTSCKAVVSAPYQTEEDTGNVPMADETMEINERSTNKQLGPVLKNVGINTDSSIVPASSTRHEHNSVNQYATGHPLVSTAKDCDIDGHEKESFITSGFLCHGAQDVKLQTTANTGQLDELDCTFRLHPGASQNIQAGDNQIDNSGQTSTVSTENQIPYDQEEAAQHQRGKRKRLQFEAVENLRMSIGCNRNSCNYATEASDVESSITRFHMETVNASHAESITTSGNKQAIQSVPGNVMCRLSFNVDRSGRYNGSSPVTAPRPSGIGLHLNSIGGAGSMNCNTNMQLLEKDASVQEEVSFAKDNDQVSQEKNCLASMSLTGHSVKFTSSSEDPLSYAGIENNEEKQQRNQAIKVPNSSVNDQSPLCPKPLNISLPVKLIDHCMTPCTMIVPFSEEASRSEESTQTSPRKKRKKAPENEGHKRCNCKRSKCLKLYCDCFAAGSFCSEACACQECFNKPEYEDTVQGTRQQIESRNPLAFAPKVVLRVTDPPKDSGDRKHITPTSARHKRGCNCKKSLCLKKYCECYQAGVGCSLGCRCEGCKNSFGRKDGCAEISEIVIEHKRLKEGGWERDLSGELEGIEVKRELANTKQCHSRLSPLTPSVQTSVGNDVSKPQFPASYYPSPGSGVSILPSYEDSPSAAMDPIQNVAFAEEREGSSALIPYNPDFEYHNAGKVDQFSPGWEGFPDICNLSPLLKTSPSAGGTSSQSKTRASKVLQTKLFQGSGRISLGSLCWRSSPVTPLPQFGESKFVREPDSESVPHCNPEDDTPEILKDTRSPIKAVKATSPNQKRVSPPHQVIHGTRSNSPSGLRSGRKFVLRSVPAFPPLTPYSNNTRGDGT